MSYLLESLGRGLLTRLLDAFERRLPGDPNERPELLEPRLRQSPASLDLALRFGKACLRDVRLSDARRAFESVIDAENVGPRAAIGLACVYDELGKLDQSLRYLAVAQAHDPRDPALAFGVGFCQERRGDSSAAATAYRGALELCPTLRNARERLAAIAVHREDWAEAALHYEALMELEPGDLDVRLTLAALRLHAGLTAEAIDLFQRALLIEPEPGREAIDRVEELESDGQLAAAIGKLEKLVAKYPGVTELHVHLGDLYVKAAEDERAVEQYNVALELHPSLLEATVKLGTQHLRRGRYEHAALAFNRAVELNDRLLLGFVGLGVAQASADRWPDAQATFGLATGLSPNSTLLLSEAARLQLRTERGRRADMDFEIDGAPAADPTLVEAVCRHQKAVVARPDDAAIQYRYGVLARQLGDSDEAVTSLKRAAEINPSYAQAWIKLGVCLHEACRPDDAHDAFRRAIFTTTEEIDLHYRLALMFSQRNQFDLAVERFGDADEDRASSLNHGLEMSLQNVGLVDRAEATWRSLCDLTWLRGSAVGTPLRRFASGTN